MTGGEKGAEQGIVSELQKAAGGSVRRGVPGAHLTTFAIGGPLAYLAEAQSCTHLAELLRLLKQQQLPWRIIGNGSNLLIPDAGLDEVVLKLGTAFRFTQAAAAEGEFDAGARTPLMILSRDLTNAGFSGLEFAGGIPGLLGGAIRMNAGAHGGQMADIVKSVSIMMPGGEELIMNAAELEFGYRHCSLPKDAVITGARLALTPGDARRSAALRSAWLAERKQKQPLSLPSAGSIFRNPGGSKSAGWLLEQAGMKGAVKGGARISDLHANWIVNPERTATAADVRGLIELCRERVAEKFSIDLLPELVMW